MTSDCIEPADIMCYEGMMESLRVLSSTRDFSSAASGYRRSFLGSFGFKHFEEIGSKKYRLLFKIYSETDSAQGLGTQYLS